MLLAATLAPLQAGAETVYVTDELRLGLYDNEMATGRQFKTLVSGAALEVLEKSLMTIRVRTEEGDEGWVKTAYIVTEEPGRRRAAGLAVENEKLQATIEASSAELLAAQARISNLETELADAQAGIEELPELRNTNAELEAQLASVDAMVARHWLLIAALAMLIIGFGAGYYWLDRRVRKQFGGVRVY
jgi:SH3 domain protein